MWRSFFAPSDKAMKDSISPTIVLCEAILEDNKHSKRCSVLAAFAHAEILHLDQKISIACKEAGYKFMYTEYILDADQYIAQSLPHYQKVTGLCQQLDSGKSYALTASPIACEDTQLTDLDYLTLEYIELAPLEEAEFTPLEAIPWIDEQLKKALFAQKEGDLQHTYLIIHSANYMQCGLMTPLDMIDELPVECLYTGQAAIDYHNNAPYLIDMTLPEKALEDTSLVPRFHRKFFDQCWQQQVGIFVRTSTSLSKVHQHFRKLLKIPDAENDRMLNFHFYDPQVMSFLLAYMNNQPAYIGHWFDMKVKLITPVSLFAALVKLKHFTPIEKQH